jgi:hypothetical protein
LSACSPPLKRSKSRTHCLHALPGERDSLLGSSGNTCLVKHHDLGWKSIAVRGFSVMWMANPGFSSTHPWGMLAEGTR